MVSFLTMKKDKSSSWEDFCLFLVTWKQKHVGAKTAFKRWKKLFFFPSRLLSIIYPFHVQYKAAASLNYCIIVGLKCASKAVCMAMMQFVSEPSKVKDLESDWKSTEASKAPPIALTPVRSEVHANVIITLETAEPCVGCLHNWFTDQSHTWTMFFGGSVES